MSDASPKVDGTKLRHGTLMAASIVVILAGLRAAQPVVIPIIFSGFLTILALPVTGFLRKHRVPKGLAILMTVLFFGAVLGGLAALLAESVRVFTIQIVEYEDAALDLLHAADHYLEGVGVASDTLSPAKVGPAVVVPMLKPAVNALSNMLSKSVVITIIMTFLLVEAEDWARKAEVAFRFTDKERALGVFIDTTSRVQRYLVIKTFASLATAFFATLGAAVMGLDFLLIWFVITYILNYIPTVGSILAALPPALFALVQFGPGAFLVILGWWVFVNLMVGNVIEPRFLGRSLGISPLIVFISLLFWGWLWGPVGAFFSVPMTVIAKIFLMRIPSTQWAGVLLGSRHDAEVLAAELEAQPDY